MFCCDLFFLPILFAEPPKNMQILTHLSLNKMATITQTIFSETFSWMKIFVFWLKFHWSRFPRVQLTITQHWFRKWLDIQKVTSHYLNQSWPDSMRHICGSRGRWVKHKNLSTMTDNMTTKKKSPQNGIFHGIYCISLCHWFVYI